MTYLVWLLFSFHLLPLLIFIFYRNTIGFSKLNLLISCLIFFSLLSDLIGVWLATSRFNTAPVSNSYQIVDRILVFLILNSVSIVSIRTKRLVVITSVLISICQLYYCISNGFLVQNDYIKLLSGVLICFYALYTLFILISSAELNPERLVINIWPVFAIFIYSASMLISQMITNINDSVEFPILFRQIRQGVALGSNVIRDSLFAYFFFLVKKMNYDDVK